MTKNKYFGTDGIRGGKFGQYPMTPEFVYRLGVAAGRALKADKEEQVLFVIGRDTRVSGPILQTALATGLRESGARVWTWAYCPRLGLPI